MLTRVSIVNQNLIGRPTLGTVWEYRYPSNTLTGVDGQLTELLGKIMSNLNPELNIYHRHIEGLAEKSLRVHWRSYR